jgi:LuxR family transcriptional regulator, maltose regulon positive regulatory protein
VHLAERATDPLGLTAFLHVLATLQNLRAHYTDALHLAAEQLTFASRYRLGLPIVHARLNQAISWLGLGDFRKSANALDDIGRQLPASGDAYLEPTIRTIRCRLLTAMHQFQDAISLTEDEGDPISSPPLRAEYLAYRALAFACTGDRANAMRLIEQARAAFPSLIEARVLAECTLAVAAIQDADEKDARRAALLGWRAAKETGNFDSLVCSYRAEPRILTYIAERASLRAEASELLGRTRDPDLARELGMPVRTSRREGVDGLTAREIDVLRELQQGFSNREIAGRLFVTEATVKAHLRHIYEKLGVRTRSELLARRLSDAGD